MSDIFDREYNSPFRHFSFYALSSAHQRIIMRLVDALYKDQEWERKMTHIQSRVRSLTGDKNARLYGKESEFLYIFFADHHQYYLIMYPCGTLRVTRDRTLALSIDDSLSGPKSRSV